MLSTWIPDLNLFIILYIWGYHQTAASVKGLSIVLNQRAVKVQKVQRPGGDTETSEPLRDDSQTNTHSSPPTLSNSSSGKPFQKFMLLNLNVFQ